MTRWDARQTATPDPSATSRRAYWPEV